jgi:hypothetical protein
MKKLLLLPLFIFIFSGCASDYNSVTITPQANRANTTVVETSTEKIDVVAPTAVKELPKAQLKIATPVKDVAPDLSNHNYYTNTAGNAVHSPAYAPSIPAGASAKCGDGTYSFSQSRRGTCSHHGGVAIWY